MSAVELRKAAETLRERAEAATPGPWLAFERNLGARVNECTCSAPGYPYGHEYHCGIDGPIAEASEPDIAYIATMHPGVGLALADVLAGTADRVDDMNDASPRPLSFEMLDMILATYGETLALARIINGGAS